MHNYYLLMIINQSYRTDHPVGLYIYKQTPCSMIQPKGGECWYRNSSYMVQISLTVVLADETGTGRPCQSSAMCRS